MNEPSALSVKLAACAGPAHEHGGERVAVDVGVVGQDTRRRHRQRVSSLVENASAVAAGASFTGLTVIVTVARFESAVPSFAL